MIKMFQCPCYMINGSRCAISSNCGYCLNHKSQLDKHTNIILYEKNILRITNYNDIVARELFIKFEQKQMKKEEDIYNAHEDILNKELAHAEQKKRHEEFMHRKYEVLESRRLSSRSGGTSSQVLKF